MDLLNLEPDPSRELEKTISFTAALARAGFTNTDGCWDNKTGRDWLLLLTQLLLAPDRTLPYIRGGSCNLGLGFIFILLPSPIISLASASASALACSRCSPYLLAAHIYYNVPPTMLLLYM